MAGALTKQLNESFKYTSSFNWLLSPYLITNKKYIFLFGDGDWYFNNPVIFLFLNYKIFNAFFT